MFLFFIKGSCLGVMLLVLYLLLFDRLLFLLLDLDVVGGGDWRGEVELLIWVSLWIGFRFVVGFVW